jgi:hypothetical protein
MVVDNRIDIAGIHTIPNNNKKNNWTIIEQ